MAPQNEGCLSSVRVNRAMRVGQVAFQGPYIYRDGAIREMIVWRLRSADAERPHGLKYRLFYGYPDQSMVRYDNERDTGDHRHCGDQEEQHS